MFNRCVSLILVLGEIFASGFDESILVTWFWSYCELLERRRLFVARYVALRSLLLTKVESDFSV